MFLDDYEYVSGCTCSAGIIKNINIKQCQNCKRCIYIKNPESINLDDVHIYCLKMKMPKDKLDIVGMINYIKNNAINAIKAL